VLQRGCDVGLYLQQLPAHTPEGYSLAVHLQVLMGKGLKVWKITQLPKWQFIIDPEYSEPRIIGAEWKDDVIVLEDQIGARQLLSTISRDAVTGVVEEWQKIPKKPVKLFELEPPQDVRVFNLRATSRSDITEQSLFGEIFAKPCKNLLIHDPYLFDRERIVNRLGVYIAMAAQHTSLEDVIVHTKPAPDRAEQIKSEQELNRKFNEIIRFKHTADHDRFIEITRLDGQKARIILGRGLDFIQPDGSIKSTYIVIQDPVD
jgi:hypothetical protein